MPPRPGIVSVASPGATDRIEMPSARAALSREYSAALTCSASRCASLMIAISSSSSEIRRALFDEGAHAFAIIVACPEFALVVALEVQLLLQSVLPGGAERLLGSRKPARRRRGELLRERLDGRCQRIVIDHLPDHAPAGGILRAQLLSRQGKAERPGRSDEPRERPRARGIRHQAQLAERLYETGRAGGDDQIAGDRDIGAGAGSDAVHRRDHGHGEAAQGRDEWRVVFFNGFAEIDGRGTRSHGPIVEVLARAEATARSREH